MATRPRQLRGVLGHEGDAEPHLVRHFLEALLVHAVAVGHGQHVAVAHVQLVLARTPLALGTLHRHAGVPQMPPHRAVETFLPEALEHVVVLDVAAGRGEVVVVLVRRLPVRVVEQVVLQLRRGHGLESQAAERLRLPPQDGPRRFRHQVVGGVVPDVAEHHGGLLLPAQPPQGAQVGRQVEVAVPLLPVGQPVALHRLHLHVHGQEIVARVGAFRHPAFQEETRVQALSHEPSVEVGERHQHGVHPARGHLFLQPGHVEHAGDFSHSVFPSLNCPGRRYGETRVLGFVGAFIGSYPTMPEISTGAVPRCRLQCRTRCGMDTAVGSGMA